MVVGFRGCKNQWNRILRRSWTISCDGEWQSKKAWEWESLPPFEVGKWLKAFQGGSGIFKLIQV
jgi:hypothetical protein